MKRKFGFCPVEQDLDEFQVSPFLCDMEDKTKTPISNHPQMQRHMCSW